MDVGDHLKNIRKEIQEMRSILFKHMQEDQQIMQEWNENLKSLRDRSIIPYLVLGIAILTLVAVMVK